MEDYSPIVEQGTLEEPSGIFGRMMRRRELPTVGVGVELVLADREGKPLAGGQLSAGEKAWARATSWIKVDVAEHTLDVSVPFSDPTGRAGFVAVMTISVKIVDSTGATTAAVDSVSDIVAPALTEAVASCASGITAKSTDDDPVAVLNDSRRAAESTLRASMPKDLSDLPRWLEARVKSINVTFDDETQHHYHDLVARSRHGELSDADAVNEKRETTHAIDLRSQWREALSEHLSDPTARSFELVFANPTPENIAQVVDQVNASEAVNRERVFQVLSNLIDKDHINQTSELSDIMRQIVASVQIGEGRETPPSLLVSQDAQPVLEAEGHTVEEPVVDDPSERDP